MTAHGEFLKTFYLLIILLSLISASPATAEQPISENDWENTLLDANVVIAKWFDDVAESIDVFIAGRQLKAKENKSKIRFENITNSNEGQNITNDFAASVILRLPNLEEYWQVKFSSYDDANEKRNSQTAYLNKNSRLENYGASVGLFRKLGDISVTFQPRIDLKLPLKISHLLSFESTANMKTYIIKPKVELYAAADKGTGFYWSLNFIFNYAQNYTLTLINDGDYISQLHTNNVTNGFSISKTINDKSSLSYGFLTFSNNRPNYHLDGCSLFTTWNRTIYKDVLGLQLTPHLDFSSVDLFRVRAGITMNINLDF